MDAYNCSVPIHPDEPDYMRGFRSRADDEQREPAPRWEDLHEEETRD